MPKIDLHVHTTASDGEKTPKEMVDFAIKKGVKAIALADHDTIDGVEEAIEYSKDKDVEVVGGIEISCNEKEKNLFDIHIVGLFVDYNNQELIEFTKKMKESRIVQKTKMLEILNDLGYEVTIKELEKEANGGSYGKPHLANILLRKYPEKFKDTNAIYKELLGNGKKADVHRKGTYNISETIKLIHEANGIAILAHPGFLHNNVEKVVDLFVDAGGDGIEVESDYQNLEESFSKNIISKTKLIAQKNNLLISGGTDFHSEDSNPSIGTYGVTEEEFEKLKKFRA